MVRGVVVYDRSAIINSLNGITASLRELFDSMYIDEETGQPKGGFGKLAELTSQPLIDNLKLGNQFLYRILVDTTTILAARYPKSIQIEDKILEMEKVWMVFQSENSQLLLQNRNPSDLELLEVKFGSQIYFLHNRVYPTLSLWKARRTLQDVRWVAGIF